MALQAVAQSWWRHVAEGGATTAVHPYFMHSFSAVRHYHRAPYAVKVGIPEFLNAVGKGVETYAGKLEAEIGDLDRLLVTRCLRLKKLGIKCQHRKLILKYTHKFRLGLWRPRVEPKKMSA